MFNDCGWEYIAGMLATVISEKRLRKNGIAEEIFCDKESRLYR